VPRRVDSPTEAEDLISNGSEFQGHPKLNTSGLLLEILQGLVVPAIDISDHHIHLGVLLTSRSDRQVLLVHPGLALPSHYLVDQDEVL
jgi:hypothetical protein